MRNASATHALIAQRAGVDDAMSEQPQPAGEPIEPGSTPASGKPPSGGGGGGGVTHEWSMHLSPALHCASELHCTQ